MKIQVIKKGGSLEDFEKDKIERVTTAAGLSQDQAKKLADDIGKWAENLEKKQIPTLQIRNQVVAKLKNINQFAYSAFVWYAKTKDRGLNSGESG